jgi:hypothetical protein
VLTNDYLIKEETLKNIAKSIENIAAEKPAKLTPIDMPLIIDKFSDTTNDTVAPNQMLEGVTAHDNSGKQIIGTIPT